MSTYTESIALAQPILNATVEEFWQSGPKVEFAVFIPGNWTLVSAQTHDGAEWLAVCDEQFHRWHPVPRS